LNRNLDLNIVEFVIFNWKSVAEMVDAVGGVDLDISKDELYDMSINGPSTAYALGEAYVPVAGTGIQHLNGVQAADYCRIRKHSGGDGARTARSRETLTAIFHEAKALNLTKLENITNDVLPEIRTNIIKKDLVKYLMGLRGYSLDGSTVFPTNYHGEIIGGLSYVVPMNLGSNVKEIHKFLFGQGDYVLSDVSQEINDKIIRETGIDI